MATSKSQSNLKRPSFQDVLEATSIIYRYIQRTPLHYYASLSNLLEAEVYLKHENHHALGVFKVRGGVNLLAHMREDDRRRGVITASTGNHGLSVAYACRLFGVRATIGVPEGSNPLKVEAIRSLGAQVVFHGAVFDEAHEYCEKLAEEKGLHYAHPANEPLLIAGVATETLETLEDLPGVEVIIVPVGGGTSAAGACIVAKAVNPNIRVIAVQSEQAPAAYRAWKSRSLTSAPNTTLAEGLATGAAYQLTQEILWDLLDDFVLVSDRELLRCVGMLLDKAHTVAEPAGAAALAGALKLKEAIRGKKVALVVTGGNISLNQLKEAIKVYEAEEQTKGNV